MAKEEFDAWYGYLEARKEDLPKPDFEIDAKDLSLVKENFDRFKVRNNNYIKKLFNRTEKHTRLLLVKS